MRPDHDVSTHRLPPGQRALDTFPRFGVVAFAKRPIESMEIRIEVFGAVDTPIVLTAAELASLPRATLNADFHCAAGWSHRNLMWSGYRFADVWERLMGPHIRGTIELLVLRCQDGFRTSLPLVDLLAPEVLIVDRLNGEPLAREHGAPLRLIAPAHYGYKSAKHLKSVELRVNARGYRPLLPRLLDHPRARVALEERGQFLPGWLLRYAFRPFIQPMIRKLAQLTDQSEKGSAGG
jgi:DMSO/TMAO reductase YedYZ molybdopterin-dependent catalytic subunit